MVSTLAVEIVLLQAGWQVKESLKGTYKVYVTFLHCDDHQMMILFNQVVRLEMTMPTPNKQINKQTNKQANKQKTKVTSVKFQQRYSDT